MCSDIICNSNKLALAAGGLGVFLLLLYLIFPNTSFLLVFVIPFVLGLVFLALWALTTATGLASWNKLVAIAYIATVLILDLAVYRTINAAVADEQTASCESCSSLQRQHRLALCLVCQEPALKETVQ